MDYVEILKAPIVIEPIFSVQTPATPKLEEVTPEIKRLCVELVSFANYNKYRSLAGLAANQVSINGERCMLNICFVAVGERLRRRYPDLNQLSGSMNSTICSG